jgi:hypothetical protein
VAHVNFPEDDGIVQAGTPPPRDIHPGPTAYRRYDFSLALTLCSSWAAADVSCCLGGCVESVPQVEELGLSLGADGVVICGAKVPPERITRYTMPCAE